MSEAIIFRKSVSKQTIYELTTEVIQFNTNWIVPETLNNQFDVRIFGGGGGGGYMNGWALWTGGGGGWMNNAVLELTSGSIIPIIIGIGGNGVYFGLYGGGNGATGGTTSFGAYLSANGGTGGTTSEG